MISKNSNLIRFLVAAIAHVGLLLWVAPRTNLFSSYRDPGELYLMLEAALLIGVTLASVMPLIWRGPSRLRWAASLLCIYPLLTFSFASAGTCNPVGGERRSQPFDKAGVQKLNENELLHTPFVLFALTFSLNLPFVSMQ